MKKFINVFLLPLILIVFVSACDKKENSKTPEKDVWGGYTRSEWMDQAVKSPIYDYAIQLFDLNGPKESEYKRKLAGCCWDAETQYLESIYGKAPPEKDINYRYKAFQNKPDLRSKIVTDCIKEIFPK